MKQGIVWGVIFAIVALLVFPLIAPIVLRGANMRQAGAAAFFILLLLGGCTGFAFGLLRSRHKKK